MPISFSGQRRQDDTGASGRSRRTVFSLFSRSKRNNAAYVNVNSDKPEVSETSVVRTGTAAPIDDVRVDIAENGPETSTTTISTNATQPVSLWDEAYEALRKDSEECAQRIERFEILLTVKMELQDAHGDDEVSMRESQLLENGDARALTNAIQPASRRSQMDRVLETGLRSMNERRLRLYLGGTEVIVGDQLAKVSKFISWSQSWVGTACSLQPQATIAWTAISMILPLITNPATAREAQEAGYKEATTMTQYYAHMEQVYLPQDATVETQSDSPSSPQAAVKAHRKELENAIRDLYKAILDLQIQSVIRFYTGRFKTFFKDAGQLDDWSSLTKTVETSHAKVKEMVQEMRSAQTLESLGALESKLKSAQMAQEEWDQHFSKVIEIAGAIKDHLETFTAEQLVQNEQQRVHNKQQQEATQKLQDLMKVVVDEKSREGLAKLLTALDRQIPGGANASETKDRNPSLATSTAKWVLENDKYQRWLEKPSGLLLISCPPGCGKSVLSRHLVDSALPSAGKTMVGYFFFDQHTVAQAVCGILHQMFSTYEWLALPVIEMFEKQPSFVTSRDTLGTILEEAMKKLGGNASLVLDALDQCKDEDAGELLQKKFTDKDIHMVITTRPYSYITTDFDTEEGQSVSYIRGETEAALNIIAEEVQSVIIQEVTKLKWPDAGKELLRQRMIAVRNPTYLWVRLIFDSVKPRRKHHFYPSMSNIKKLVSTLPASFQHVYDGILKETTDFEKLQTAMGIIIAAQRPLTLRQMNTALHISQEITSLQELEEELIDDTLFEDTLRQWCGLFIVIQNNFVYLLHETAKEFLISSSPSINPGPSSLMGSITMSQAHLAIGEICMRSLQFSDLLNDGGEPVILNSSGFFVDDLIDNDGVSFNVKLQHPRFSFIIYASLHWGDHIREAKRTPPKMEHIYDELCDPTNGSCQSWLALYLHHFGSAILSGIYLDTTGVRAFLGHFEQLKDAIKMDKFLLEPPSDRGGTELMMPILFAAVLGKHVALVRWLLEQGASPNDSWGPHTPLVQLIDDGDPQMLDLVPLFLEKGASTGLVGLNEFEDKTPVFTAAQRGFAGIVETILKHEVAIGVPSTASLPCFGDTPLHRSQDGATTRMLLQHNANPDIRNSSGLPLETLRSLESKRAILVHCRGILSNAAEREALLRTFLNRAGTGPEVALYFELGGKPTSLDAEGSLPLFSIVDLQKDYGYRPEDQRQIMLELLRHCDPEVKNEAGNTALLHYVSLGASVATRTLIEQGADVFSRGSSGRTVLHYAVNKFQSPQYKLLPSAKIMATIIEKVSERKEVLFAQDDEGNTALHLACAGPNTGESMIKVLLDHGFEIEAVAHDGRTPLLAAATSTSDSLEKIEVLLDARANPFASDNQGRTLLHLFFTRRFWDQPRDLLAAVLEVADIDAADMEGTTPLMSAVRGGFIKHIPALLDKGADCGISDMLGRQALHYLHPAHDWSLLVPEMAKKQGDVSAKTLEGETPLHTIMLETAGSKDIWYQPRIAAALIYHGADVDAKRADGKTPLHLACLRKCYQTARVLLEAGCDVAAVDAEGKQPLDMVTGTKRRVRFEKLLSRAEVLQPWDKTLATEAWDGEED